MLTCVHPGPKLKAAAVCLNRDCTFPWNVSWREEKSDWNCVRLHVWNQHVWGFVITWMATLNMNNGLVKLLCTANSKHRSIDTFSPHSTFLTGHSVSMHPAESCDCYPLPQWSAAGGSPLRSWGSRQHESPSPLAKGLPQTFQVWSTPGINDTACIHTVSHDEYSYRCTV